MNNILEFKKQELKLLEKANYSNNPHKYLKWFLTNAEFFTDVDLKLSKKVSIATDSRVKMCYHNCWKAVTEPQFYFKLRYFEGFVWSKDCPIPLEHSWLIARNGKVVDPTLIIEPELATKQLKQDYKFDNDDEKLLYRHDNDLRYYNAKEKRIADEYFGVEFPIRQLNNFVMKHKKTGGFLTELFLEGKK